MAKKILVVEDESALQKILLDTIKRADYTAILAKNGKRRYKICVRKTRLNLPDIILPELSGFDVLEQTRVKYNSNVPVIIVSSLGEKEDREMGKTFMLLITCLNLNLIKKSDIKNSSSIK
jgi:DNA-binding response OmpR family regulator